MRARLGTLLVAALATMLIGTGAVIVRSGADRLGLAAVDPDHEPAGAGRSRPPSVTAGAADRAKPPVPDRVVVDVPPTTEAPPPPPPPTEPPTTAPPPPPTEPPAEAAAAAPAVPAQRFTLDAYRGLGAWIDVYDWSVTITNGNPGVGEAEIDRMAALGVRTIYLQASHNRTPDLVLEEPRLRSLIDRAHGHGMQVVAWYLPTLVDPDNDLARLLAIAALPVDGLGVDIESRAQSDVGLRNQFLQYLSHNLRLHLPNEVLSAIVIPPVQMEDVNPAFWPGFPWDVIGHYYDVYQPMAYWTERRSDSGWQDGYSYIAANIDRIRAHVGRPDAPVHPVGGIATDVTVEHLAGMVRAAVERAALGGSLYDYRTTGDHLWAALLPFNG